MTSDIVFDWRGHVKTTDKPTPEFKSPLMAAEEIALLLPKGRGSRKTVENWWSDGILPSVKVGRFRFSRRTDVATFFGLSVDDLP